MFLFQIVLTFSPDGSAQQAINETVAAGGGVCGGGCCGGGGGRNGGVKIICEAIITFKCKSFGVFKDFVCVPPLTSGHLSTWREGGWLMEFHVSETMRLVAFQVC